MGETRQMLLGKELVFSKEIDLFNSLRKKYLLLSVEARKKAEEAYDAKLNSYEAYVRNCRTIMDDIFEQYLQMGVTDMIKYGVYDIDEIVLRQEFEAEFGSEYSQTVDSLVEQIRQIDMEQMAADQERKEMIRDAGPIEGTYVATNGNIASDMASIAGAQIETAVINSVFKGATALVTGGARAIEKKGAEREKKALFGKNSTKIDLLEGMEQDVYTLHRTIARLINERTGINYFYYAKEEDINRFEPVCRNILRGNFKSEDLPDLEKEQIYNVVRMNPYELRMYYYVMKENAGITEELKNLMDYLCVDKASLANSYLEEKYDLDDYTTYEEMVEFEKVVMEELRQFSVEVCDFSYDVISKKETLYIERRTFRQYIYETIEERDFAEEQFYAFVGEGFMELEIDELLEKYEATYDKAFTEKNREDICGMLMSFIVAKVDEFQSMEILAGYVAYAQAKKVEHQLEQSELLDVFEKKYKKLERKMKINAGAAAAKEKLVATAGSVMGHGKDLMQKIPFGKKTSADKDDVVVEGTAAEITTEAATEAMTEATAETPATAAAEPVEGKKKFGFSSAKDMFSGLTGKMKNGIDS